LYSAADAWTQTLRNFLLTNTLTTVPCGRCTWKSQTQQVC
jgi:hypothetical protein